jgi:hypothetical protein
MKRGDIIARKTEILVGTCLLRGLESEEKAELARESLPAIYGVEFDIEVEVLPDGDNPGCFGLFARVPFSLEQRAKVNWVVDVEAGITYLSASGGSAVIDLREQPDWVVVQEATPEYQSSVEHMTDEQLRESIEALRLQRISKPVTARSKRVVEREPAQSPEDKKLAGVVKGLDEGKKLELMKKLGLVD